MLFFCWHDLSQYVRPLATLLTKTPHMKSTREPKIVSPDFHTVPRIHQKPARPAIVTSPQPPIICGLLPVDLGCHIKPAASTAKIEMI